MSLLTPKRRGPRVRFSGRRRGRAAGKPRGNIFVLSVGAAVVIVAAIMFYIGYDAPDNIPGRSYYTIYAYMHDADNLEDHYDVRIGGLLAGQVLNTKVVNHLARVELQLSSAFKPIRTGSTILIRLRSAVGVRYVQITPNPNGTPIPNGGSLPASATSSPVNLDQVLDIFSQPVRGAIDDFFGELGQGLNGEGDNVNETIHEAPGTLQQLGSLSAAVNANINSLKNLVSGGQETAGAVAPVSAYMTSHYATDNVAAQPFIVKRAELDATLSQAPSTLATASQQLPEVNKLLVQVDGLAHAAEPTLLVAPAALRDTTSLLVTARPRLKDANATLQLLNTAVNPTLQFLQTTQPVLPQIDDTLTDLEPTVDYAAPRACGISTAMTGWSEMMKWGTPSQNFIRFTADDTGPLVGLSTAAPLTSPYGTGCTAAGVDESGPQLQTPEQQTENP